MNSTNRTLHRVSLFLVAVYLVALVLIVFWPTPVDRPAAANLNRFIDWMHSHGVPAFIGYRDIEFGANIALFIPMGIIASVWTRRVWVGPLLGLLTSILIEVSQATFLAERFASGLDVVANTAGAVIGTAVYFFIYGVQQSRATRAAVKQDQPRHGQ